MRRIDSCVPSTTKSASTARPGPAVGALIRATFSDLLANGQAVGRVNGVVVFAWGPLPGERASLRVTQVKPKYVVADVVEIESSSELRVTPFCGVFGVCGGCQVQHLSYPGQLAWKEQLVRSALRRIGGLAGVRVARTVGMEWPRAYRNKMSLVAQARETTTVGFYQARSHALVPIDACPIVLPQLNATIPNLIAASRESQTAPAFEGVKHVIVRAGAASGQSVVSLTTERGSAAIANSGRALAQRLPGAVGVSNSFEPRSANAVMGRRIAHVWGAREMEETIEGVRFRVSAASFFQINSEMVGRIFRFMAPGLKTPRRIVDLYCGAGTFAIYFATRGAHVVGIEENEAAIREARANAALNGVEDSAKFLVGRVEGSLGSREGRAAVAAAEIIFLDPPRKGSDERTLDAIAEAHVPNVWYLSCNPATLARDLARLVGHGYVIGIVQPFDMFPQTGHVETLVTLYRRAHLKLDLPEAEATEWSRYTPTWPSDDRYAEHDYPAFVEQE